MTQLRQHDQQFRDRNVSIAVVSFDSDAMAKAYSRHTNLEWPLLIDSDRSVYESYGMVKGSWWSIYNPSSIWKYLKLIFAGNRPGRSGSDHRQFGGDVLIGPDGNIRLFRASQSPHDRPSVSELLTAVSDE